MATTWFGLDPMGRPMVLDRRAAGRAVRGLSIVSDATMAELVGGGL